MSQAWLPALYALFLWWFGTGAILLLDRLPRPSRRASLFGVSVLALAALWVVWLTAGERSVGAALAGFTAAIVLWGWHELTFLTGLITGPRRAPCPPGARGWTRFRMAAATLIHHEIALAVTVVALAAWLWDAANPMALCTFTLLWVLRLSAKFNLFLGAPNVAEEFLPDDLRYLESYFARRPVSLLFPVSVTVGTGLAAWWAAQAGAADVDGFTAAVYALCATLTALGVLEHWFMALPFREAALWKWWMENRTRGRRDAATGAAKDGAPAAFGALGR